MILVGLLLYDHRFWHIHVQPIVDGLPYIGLRVDNQLVGLVDLHCGTLIDAAEGAADANSVGSRVTIIYPSISSCEGVDVQAFNHCNVSEVRRMP